MAPPVQLSLTRRRARYRVHTDGWLGRGTVVLSLGTVVPTRLSAGRFRQVVEGCWPPHL